MKTFKLRIITSKGSLVKTDVSSFTGYTVEGSFTILPDHSPMIAQLADSSFTYVEDGVRKEIRIEDGLMKFKDNRLLISAAKGEFKTAD